jgi:hypothetical protein
MGTQTGEQRVAVVGRAVDADGLAVSGVEVVIEDPEGALIATARTDVEGNYSVEVAREEAPESLIVSFTTRDGEKAAASVSTAGVNSVTVNLQLTSGGPQVVVPTPTPTPTSQPNPPTATPTSAPPPGATSTPNSGQVTSTPTPIATASPTAASPPPPISTVPSDDGAVCALDSQVDSDQMSEVCCTEQQVYEAGCCNDYWRDKGLC